MKQETNRVIVLGIVLIVIIVLVIKNVNEAKSMDKNGVYVIGKIEKIRGSIRNVKIFVTYSYKGKNFKSDYITDNFDQNVVMIKKYFFRIDTCQPSQFHIEYYVPIPDSIKESPPNGWDSLPVASYYK